MRDNSAHMTLSVHSHRHDALTVPLRSYYTVQLQIWRVHCPISAQICRLMISNHFREFCYSFDSRHNKNLCRERTNSQDQNVPITTAPSQIYSCWSLRVSKKKIHSLTTISWHVAIDLQSVSKGPLVAAFRSPLMKALDRSVETLGLWIVTSSVTFIKSANQCSIKLCMIVHLVAVWTLIYL